MSPTRPRDDRVLPETRWAALVVFFILVPATAILWGAPDQSRSWRGGRAGGCHAGRIVPIRPPQ